MYAPCAKGRDRMGATERFNMANENAEKAPEEKTKDVSESKTADTCTRECLQFEWLNNMGTKLPAARDAKQPSGLSDLTITPEGNARTERSAEQTTVHGKFSEQAMGKAVSDQAAGKAAGEQTPGKAESDQAPGKTVSDQTPGKSTNDVTPSKANRDEVPGLVGVQGYAKADQAKLVGDQTSAPSSDVLPVSRDVRKEIIHLAEYGHCSFADRNEYRDTLDKVMKEFSEKADVSDRNKLLQSMVADFLKNPNQESYAEFYKRFNAFFMESSRLAKENLRELEAETAKNMTPERIKAEQDMNKKNDAFFKELDKLPKEEKNRILCTMDWQDEVSKDERNARTREALAKHPKLLEAFNALQSSTDKRDAIRSPREAQLAELHRQNVRDNILARSISKLLLHRSRIS